MCVLPGQSHRLPAQKSTVLRFMFSSSRLQILNSRDFPGGPVVKTLPYDAGGMGLIL